MEMNSVQLECGCSRSRFFEMRWDFFGFGARRSLFRCFGIFQMVVELISMPLECGRSRCRLFRISMRLLGFGISTATHVHRTGLKFHWKRCFQSFVRLPKVLIVWDTVAMPIRTAWSTSSMCPRWELCSAILKNSQSSPNAQTHSAKNLVDCAAYIGISNLMDVVWKIPCN